jgi:hypothetical protein
VKNYLSRNKLYCGTQEYSFTGHDLHHDQSKFQGGQRQKSNLRGQHLCTKDIYGLRNAFHCERVENNICNILVENCAPYDVTLERDDILWLWETEEEDY